MTSRRPTSKRRRMVAAGSSVEGLVGLVGLVGLE